MTLQVDASSPAAVVGSATTTSTASFSPPANSLLVAFVSADANNSSATEACTVTSTGGLTWSLAQRFNGSPGSTTEVWSASATSAPGSIVVSVTDNQGAVAKRLFPRVYTDTTGGIPAGIGAINTGTAASVSYTSTVANSWGWLTGLGFNAPGAGAGETLQDSDGAFDGGDTVWTISQNATTPTAGSTVTMTLATASATHQIAVEILPAAAAASDGSAPVVIPPPLLWEILQAVSQRAVSPTSTQYSQTLTVASAVNPGAVRQVGKRTTRAVTAGAGVVRRVSRQASSTVTAAARATKRVGRRFAAGVVAGDVYTDGYGDTFTAIGLRRQVGAKRGVAGVAGVQVVRRLATKRTAAVAAATTLKRRVARAVAVTVALLVVAATGRSFLRSMTVAVSVSRVLVRRVTARRAVAVTASLAIKRALSVRRTVAATPSVVLRRMVGAKRATAVVATLTLTRRVGKRAAVGVVAVPSLARALRVAKKVTVIVPTARTVRVGRSLTAAVHTALMLGRRIGVKRTVAVTASTAVRRRITRALSVAVHAAATLVTIRVALLVLHTAVSVSASLRRRVGKRATVAVAVATSMTKRLPRALTVAVTTGPKLVRRVGRKLAVAVTAATTQTARRVHLLTLTVAVAAVTVLRRRIGRPLPRSVTASPTLVRRVGLRRTVPVAATLTLVRGLRRRLAGAVHVAGSLGTVRVALLVLHAAVACTTAGHKTVRVARAMAVTGSAKLRRRIGKVPAATVAVATAIRRQVRPRLAAAVAAAATVRRRIAAHLAAAVHATPVNRFGRLYRLVLAAAVNSATALTTIVVAGTRFVPAFGRVLAKWVLAMTGALADQLSAPVVKWKLGGGLLASIPAVSTEFVRIEVAATANGVPVDPTADTVQMAFLSTFAEPVSGDWKSASWDSANGRFYAQALIGPSGGVVTLTPGTWYVWVRIVASPETVIRNPGQLQIT